MQNTAFKYFKDNNITTRDELRACETEKPFNGPLMEGFWIEYKKSPDILGELTEKEYNYIFKSEQKEFLKVVQFNDTHVPFHDHKTLNAIFKFVRDFKPDQVVIAGDFLDFYELSRFDKNPERRFKLQEEFNIAKSILGELDSNLPTYTKIHFIKGNHEDRLRRYLWKNPELASLEVLDIQSLLDFKELDIKYHELEYILNDFIFEHGKYVRQDSSYSAKAELLNAGTSRSGGHTHRLGSYYKTDRRGTIASFEMGCTCLLEPEYITGIPNWQQGLGVFHFKDDRYYCQQVPIIHNKFIYDGKLYS